MKTRHWCAAAMLLLAACGESATSPSPAKPAHSGGGLMGSGTTVPPTPPPVPSDTTP